MCVCVLGVIAVNRSLTVNQVPLFPSCIPLLVFALLLASPSLSLSLSLSLLPPIFCCPAHGIWRVEGCCATGIFFPFAVIHWESDMGVSVSLADSLALSFTSFFPGITILLTKNGFQGENEMNR